MNTTVTLNVPPPVEQPPVTVTITMDLKTAEALYAVTCRVGGNPATTRRGRIDSIYQPLRDALRKAGVPAEPLQVTEDARGGITFL